MKKQHFLKLLVFTFFSIFLAATFTHTTLAQAPSPSEPSEYVHPVPLIPIVVDGVKMQPEEISKYDGQPLYYLVTEQSEAEGVIYIFTTLEKLTNSDELAQSSKNNNNLMTSCTNTSVFYVDTYQGGRSIGLEPGDYLTLSLPAVYFLYKNIESVKTTSCNVYTKLFGSPGQLWLACCGITNDLAIYGWDNKAVAISVNSS